MENAWRAAGSSRVLQILCLQAFQDLFVSLLLRDFSRLASALGITFVLLFIYWGRVRAAKNRYENKNYS